MGRLGFGRFPRPFGCTAAAVLPEQDRGTSQIQFNQTQSARRWATLYYSCHFPPWSTTTTAAADRPPYCFSDDIGNCPSGQSVRALCFSSGMNSALRGHFESSLHPRKTRPSIKPTSACRDIASHVVFLFLDVPRRGTCKICQIAIVTPQRSSFRTGHYGIMK